MLNISVMLLILLKQCLHVLFKIQSKSFALTYNDMNPVMGSGQVTLIYIALFTIHIISTQLHSDNMKIIQHRSIILLNIKCPQPSKPKAKATVARNQNSIR